MQFLLEVCVFPKWRGFVFRSAVPGRRQNTIVVKVPGHDDSHNEDGESGSEASDSVSNSGQLGSQSIGNNVTLITLNSEGTIHWLTGRMFEPSKCGGGTNCDSTGSVRDRVVGPTKNCQAVQQVSGRSEGIWMNRLLDYLFLKYFLFYFYIYYYYFYFY